MAIPSIKTIRRLTDYYRMPPRAAGLIRKEFEKLLAFNRKGEEQELEDVDAVLENLNKLLSGHGVEAIRSSDAWVSSYYGDIVALYINAGDTYNPTIVYDTDNGKFSVESYGDWIERQERSRRYRFE